MLQLAKTAKSEKAPYRCIIEDGEIMTFSSFPKKDETIVLASEKLLEAARRCAGPEAEKGIEREGIDQYHKFVDPDFLPFVNRFLNRSDVKNAYLGLVAEFGRSVLGMAEDFYVDDAVVFRVHFPHEVSRRSKLRRPIYRHLNLDNIDNAREEVERVYEQYRNGEASSDDAGVHPLSSQSSGPGLGAWAA